MRYRTLGETTAAEVKEYFEVSAYRNILDMLNTMTGLAQSVGNQAAILAWDFIGLVNKDALDKGTIGAAIKQVGKPVGKEGEGTYFWWAKITARKNGFKFPKGENAPEKSLNFKSHDRSAGVNRFEVDDLLEIGRQIEWEMNRVRLPVPHNFRQYLTKLQKFPWVVTFIRKKLFAYPEDPTAPIRLIEAINQLGFLIDTVKAMRTAVRKEIDGAQLAAKVQEETLRREQEELITRAKAADEAAEREIEIRKQKAIAYRAEYQLLFDRLQSAITRSEQVQLLAQLETVGAAINGLVLDSADKVVVPQIALLPTEQELASVAAEINEAAAAAVNEIDGDIQVAVQTGDAQLIAALKAERDAALQLAAKAQAAAKATASGDSATATEIIESTQPKTGAALPLILLSLLALAS
jgi:hypothetical protein